MIKGTARVTNARYGGLVRFTNLFDDGQPRVR